MIRRFFSLTFVLLVFLSSQTIQAQLNNHAAWNTLLQKYVSATGSVNYAGFKADKAALDAYLNLLSAGVPSGASKNAQMAYYINAYNAFTIKLIVDNYPVKSIRDIKAGKPWDYKFVKLGAQTYSLNQIEHEILRKQYFDPRLHFVLVCAAKSCPKLHNQAFTEANVQTLMGQLTTGFINNAARNKITAAKAQVSELFNWYKEDFTKSGTVVDFLNKYSQVKLNANAALSYLPYDWSLNQ
ncbi:MAG: DUF547 domain-containing protein [Microscillaceae bacterium]